MKIELDLWMTNGERFVHITGADEYLIYVDNHMGTPHYKAWAAGNHIYHDDAQADYLRGDIWFCESPLSGAG